MQENPTAPSLSALSTVTAAVWLSDPVVPYVTDVSSIAPDPSVHVQVGVPTSSDGSRVRVTMSPSFALPLPDVAIVADVDVGAVVSRTYVVVETAPAFPAASTILSLMLLEPLSVTAIDTPVPSAVAWSSSVHELPALIDISRVSPVARAALRVAETVWAAVFVMKSLSDEPVSAEMSTEPTVDVGAVASYQAFTSASVAAFPAKSLTLAVTADRPAEWEHDSSSHIVKVHVPEFETVAVSLAPPYVTVTVCPSAPEAVPVIVKLLASAALMYPSVATVPIPTIGAVRSTVTAPVSAEVSASIALPAASVADAQEKTVLCSVSSPESWRADVQEVPEPPMVVASPSMVQTSPDTDSLIVMVSVIVSPLLA